MAPVDIRPTGYIPQGTFSGTIPGEKGIDRRRRLAEVLAQQGTQTTPVQHWTQAAARVAQSLAGVLGNYQANQMEQQRSSALAEALKTGTADELMKSMDPDLQRVGIYKAQQAQQAAQAAHQAAQDAENKARWDAKFKQDAEQFAATQERLDRPNFTEGTPDQKEAYGPDFLGMGQNGPIFKPSSVSQGPWETKIITDAYGDQTAVQINRDTGEQRPTTIVGVPADTSAAPPAAGSATSPAVTMPGPAPVQPAAPTPRVRRMPKMTEGQDKSYRFYRRARDANKTLSPEEEQALMSGPQSAVEWAQSGFEKIPFGLGSIPSGLSEAAHSDIYQRAKVKADRIIASLNYSDSGAQINRDEYARQWKALIPIFGNGPDAVAEKRKARAGAIASLKATTGKGILALNEEEQAYAEADATIAAAPPERKDEARKRVKERLQLLGFDAENY